MIHVAPCYCQLHVEIRRLEAEVADADTQYDMCMARAEKAEARVAGLELNSVKDHLCPGGTCYTCDARRQARDSKGED